MAEFAAPDGKLSEHIKRIKRDAVRIIISGAYGTYYNRETADLRRGDQQVGGIRGTDLSVIMRVRWKCSAVRNNLSCVMI